MMKDPIVEELRQAGNDYAASFDHDLDAIVDDLRRRQETHRDRIVSFETKPTTPGPDSLRASE